jgi:hypothetical protein
MQSLKTLLKQLTFQAYQKLSPEGFPNALFVDEKLLSSG